MVIDIHTHIAYSPLYSNKYLAGFYQELSLQSGIKETDIEKLLRSVLNDPDCKKMIVQMDKAGIDKSVLLIIDSMGIEEGNISIENIYEHHFAVLKKFPDRFIVFGGIDPRRGKPGLELFKTGVYDYGFKGLKLYPPMGFRMDDEDLHPYYKICEESRIPVLIHTGPSLSWLKNEFADPKSIYEVAQKYPTINFILAHAGFSLHSPSVQLALSLKNVYVDIAGFQTQFKKVDQSMIDQLGMIFNEKYNSKVLFGTDWPLFNFMTPLVYHVNLIKELYQKVFHEKSGKPLENILYNNALQVLNIS